MKGLEARMLGCRDARKPISMVSLRISELPNLPISRLLTQSLKFATFDFTQAQRSSRTAGPLLKCNAPLAPASHHPDLIASLCISELLNFPTSQLPYLSASQPPSLQASQPPSLPASPPPSFQASPLPSLRAAPPPSLRASQPPSLQ